MNLHPALLCLPILCFGACSGGGGSNDSTRGAGGNAEIGSIEIANTNDAEGDAVTEVVVPLNSGDFAATPRVVTEFGDPCQVFAMGPRFPNGTLRFLRLEVPVRVTGKEKSTIGLSSFDGGPAPFVKHPAIAGDVGVVTRLRLRNGTSTFPDPELIEEGPVTKVYRSRMRLPSSMFWAELTISIYSGLSHGKFTLQWGNSDPRVQELYQDPGQVELQVRGATTEIEVASKVLKKREVGGFQGFLLHDGGSIGDGQSQFLEGRFIYEGSSPPRVFAIAKNWVETNAYGPFGELLPEIQVDPVQFSELIAKDEAKQTDHPWARCVHGCNPDPSNTGSQRDFGTIKMRADVVLADPRRLPTITRSVYQEACRASHHREVDVSQVRIKDHPDLLTLSGRPKTPTSKDLLGKKRAYMSNPMRSSRGARWLGHDSQHLSINYLAGIALLTGNRFAREECSNHVMLYLTGFTSGSGSYNDSPGASRTVGRTSLAAIWMWLVTGRDDVRQRLIDRTEDVFTRMQNTNTNLTVVTSRGSYWVPWQEGMAMTGLAAVHHQFAVEAGLNVIVPTSKTLVMNGFAKPKSWRCGYEVPFRFANGSDYVASQDPNFGNIAAGGGLTTWTIPGLFFAAAGHPDSAVQERASKIINERYAGPMNGLSEELDWICVSRDAAKLAGITSAYK